MGLELWPRSESYAANCVTAVRMPAGVAVGELLAHVRERYGVMLSGGYGELKEKLVRLGHMGPASRSLYPLVAVSALGRGLARPRRRGRSSAPGRRRRWNARREPGRGPRRLDAVKLTPFRLHRPETRRAGE